MSEIHQTNNLKQTRCPYKLKIQIFKQNDFYLLEEYLKFGVSLDSVVNHLDENAHYQDSLFGGAKRLELVGFSYFTENVSHFLSEKKITNLFQDMLAVIRMIFVK